MCRRSGVVNVNNDELQKPKLSVVEKAWQLRQEQENKEHRIVMCIFARPKLGCFSKPKCIKEHDKN